MKWPIATLFLFLVVGHLYADTVNYAVFGVLFLGLIGLEVAEIRMKLDRLLKNTPNGGREEVT